jgi:hypothetical protein
MLGVVKMIAFLTKIAKVRRRSIFVAVKASGQRPVEGAKLYCKNVSIRRWMHQQAG